jgi:transcriptional regulator with XRE-family HTH domain
MDSIDIGKIILAKRGEKGITQDELAKHMGVSRVSVSKWETGQSYPDIVFLPQLAAYFNISMDELMGYSPQMTGDDISKIYMELLNGFSIEPFTEVMSRCREIVRKYYSCFPLLYQIGTLLLNHGSAVKDEEIKSAALAYAKELFRRVKAQSDNNDLKYLSLHSEALCEMMSGNANEVLVLLENENMLQPNVSTGVMRSQAYLMQGKTTEARIAMQDSILGKIIPLFYDMTSYLEICTDDICYFDEVCRRAIAIMDVFNMKKLMPIITLPFYLAAAVGYAATENEDKSLAMLEAYADIATSGIFPLKTIGDSFFTFIDKIQAKQENEVLIGTPEFPRDEQSMRNEISDSVTDNPAFSSLQENQRFHSLVKKLKQIL